MDVEHPALTPDELVEAIDHLSHYSECVGAVPVELMELLETLLVRRDGAARVVMGHIASCCVPDAA